MKKRCKKQYSEHFNYSFWREIKKCDDFYNGAYLGDYNFIPSYISASWDFYVTPKPFKDGKIFLQHYNPPK